MRVLVGFVVRNWPLKIAAILLATLLYAGLIVSASAETFQGRIPIEILNQPQDTFVLGDLDDVTTVRYLALGTDRPQVTSTTFTATIDLSNVTAVAGAPPVSVPVTVRSVDPAIQVIDWTPSRVAVRLDPLVTKQVPVRVDLGTVPTGLDVRDPVVSQDTVTVSGPDQAVRFVMAARARVRIDPSGLDVNETVGLEPIDASGEVVPGVDVQPSSVRVTIQIGSRLATRTLPVDPDVTGTPDPGERDHLGGGAARPRHRGGPARRAGRSRLDQHAARLDRRGDGRHRDRGGPRPAGRRGGPRGRAGARHDHHSPALGHPRLRGGDPDREREPGSGVSSGGRPGAAHAGRDAGGPGRGRPDHHHRPPRRGRPRGRHQRGAGDRPPAGRRHPRLRVTRGGVRDRDSGRHRHAHAHATPAPTAPSAPSPSPSPSPAP